MLQGALSWRKGGSLVGKAARILAKERRRGRVYLTERIYQLVLESQLPHKIINLVFTVGRVYAGATLSAAGRAEGRGERREGGWDG